MSHIYRHIHIPSSQLVAMAESQFTDMGLCDPTKSSVISVVDFRKICIRTTCTRKFTFRNIDSGSGHVPMALCRLSGHRKYV